LTKNRALAGIVADMLRMLWSPEQIAGWLKHTYPNDQQLQVSHETIYRSLFIQARGALKKELLEHLRRTRGMRRSRSYTQKTAIHGQIVDAISISERPASVEDRRCQVTGKEIWSSAAATARSRRWSSARRDT
jgi:IS30 family transposase